MMMVRFSPLRELMQIQDRLTNLLDEDITTSIGSSAPATDMYEEDGKFIVEASLPNFKEEEIEINLTDSGLEIKAEHNEEKEKKNRKYLIREMSSGSFYRYVNLPADANIDEAKAEFNENILRVAVPIKEQPKAKRLTLTAGGKNKS